MTARALEAKDSFERVSAVVEIYIEHYKKRPCTPEYFMGVIDRVLYKSAFGKKVWGFQRNQLVYLARAALRESKMKSSGKATIPDEILNVALDLAMEESNERGKPLAMLGSKKSPGPGAFSIASARLKRDFGLSVSPSTIKAFHQKKRRAVKAK